MLSQDGDVSQHDVRGKLGLHPQPQSAQLSWGMEVKHPHLLPSPSLHFCAGPQEYILLSLVAA